MAAQLAKNMKNRGTFIDAEKTSHIEFFTRACGVDVQHGSDDWRLRKAARKKELAVMSLSLRKTQWEDILSENGAFSDIRRTVLFEPTRLTNEANARQKACLAIHKAGDVTFKDMRTTISNLWDALTRLDPSWCLEHCFLMNHAEPIAVSLLEKQAQEMFPKDDYTPSLDALVGGLDKLSKSKLCQACGMDAFNDIQGLIGMIESVKKRFRPRSCTSSALFGVIQVGIERVGALLHLLEI